MMKTKNTIYLSQRPWSYIICLNDFVSSQKYTSKRSFFLIDVSFWYNDMTV